MRLLLVGLVFAISGCDMGTTSGSDAKGNVTPSNAAELDLANLLPSDAVLVGTTFTPNGKRYVLDQHSGLYEVGDSSASLVWNTTGLTGIELTDVVALDSDRFAVTAENDGFLLNLQSGSFTSYFCYLPRTPEPQTQPISVSQTLTLQGVAVKQRTESVAFNPNNLQLFAQPQTIRLDTAVVAGSELFVFDESGGQPSQVLPVDTSFVAGGMVVASDNRLFLGAGNRIYEMTLDGTFSLLRELDAAVDVTGMARATNGDLWILDGNARRLLKLDAGL